MKVISEFKFTYENGISQTKVLISKDTYRDIKRIVYEVTLLEGEAANLGKKNKKRLELENKIKDLMKPIKELGEYFVVDSPMYDAWRTGVIVTRNGSTKVKVDCLDIDKFNYNSADIPVIKLP